jgi:RNA polymerase-associated protein RTF1
MAYSDRIPPHLLNQDEEEAASEDDDIFGGGDDSDDDDLFDSDEEAELNAVAKGAAKRSSSVSPTRDSKGKKLGGAKAKAEKKKSRRAASESDDDLGSDESEVVTKKKSKSSRTKPVKSRLQEFDDEQAESDEEYYAGRDRDVDYFDAAGLGRERGEREGEPARRGGKGATASRRAFEHVEVDDTPEATLDHYLKIQIRRTFIEKWLNEPFFERILVGMFVRYSIGERQGVHVYRMGEIKEVSYDAKRPYALAGSQTRVMIELDIAGVSKKGRLDLISNSRIRADEFDFYVEKIRSSRSYKVLTERQVINRRRDMLDSMQHSYTHDEISAMVQRKQGLGAKVINTEFSTAMESLLKKRNKARENPDDVDYEALEEVDKAIAALQESMAKEKEIFNKVSSAQISLNQRNRDSNFYKDVKYGTAKSKALKASGGQAGQAAEDPFTRRETRPTNIWKSQSTLAVEKQRDTLTKEIENLKKEAQTSSGEGRLAAAEKELADLNAKHPPPKDKREKKEDAKGAKGGTKGAGGAKDGGMDDKDVWRMGKVSLEEVRSRVKERLGVDPYEVHLKDRRDRYLQRVCAGLPPVNSAEREAMRKGVSFVEYINELTQRLEAEGDGGTNGAGGTEMAVAAE